MEPDVWVAENIWNIVIYALILFALLGIWGYIDYRKKTKEARAEAKRQEAIDTEIANRGTEEFRSTSPEYKYIITKPILHSIVYFDTNATVMRVLVNNTVTPNYICENCHTTYNYPYRLHEGKRCCSNCYYPLEEGKKHLCNKPFTIFSGIVCSNCNRKNLRELTDTEIKQIVDNSVPVEEYEKYTQIRLKKYEEDIDISYEIAMKAEANETTRKSIERIKALSDIALYNERKKPYITDSDKEGYTGVRLEIVFESPRKCEACYTVYDAWERNRCPKCSHVTSIPISEEDLSMIKELCLPEEVITNAKSKKRVSIHSNSGTSRNGENLISKG